MAEGDYGGYDDEFVEKEVDKKYQCLVCQNVLRDPMLTDCCGQHYCKSCLHQCSRSNIRECPHCRKYNYRTMLDIPLQREIKELEIYCKHRIGKNCLWEGELGSLQQHLRSLCPQRFSKCNKCGKRYTETKKAHMSECQQSTENKVACEFEGPDENNEFQTCGKKMSPSELKNHQWVCLYRQFECKFCKMESTYIAITGQTQTVKKEAKTPEEKGHYAQCPDYPLSCKNRCSLKVIRRGDMEQHLQECPLELIRCERWEEGCKEMVLRKDLKKHMKKYETQHNNYIMSAYFMKKTELQDLRGELASTKHEVLAVNCVVEDLRAELATTKDELSATKLELATTKMTLQSKTQELNVARSELMAKTVQMNAASIIPTPHTDSTSPVTIGGAAVGHPSHRGKTRSSEESSRTGKTRSSKDKESSCTIT